MLVDVQLHQLERVSKVITWQKATSPNCHPSWLQMDSSSLDPHLIHGSLDPHESAVQHDS